MGKWKSDNTPQDDASSIITWVDAPSLREKSPATDERMRHPSRESPTESTGDQARVPHREFLRRQVKTQISNIG